MLRAALLTGETALECWREWKSVVDINDIDRGSLRILPLLYRNLSIRGIDAVESNKAKGCHRMAWYKNQILFNKAAELHRKFKEGGIDVIVLKGMAMVLRHYKDPGLRPMDDVDLYVARDNALAAANVLKNHGWTFSARPDKGILTENVLDNRHALVFCDSRGDMIDLHWYVMRETICSVTDKEFFRAGETIEYSDQPVTILKPTHQLLHVCAHGAKWSGIPPIRWIADAMMILRDSANEIDWLELAALSDRLRITSYTRDSLCYLRDIFDMQIPESAAQILENADISPLEHKEYRLLTGKPSNLKRMFLVHFWFRHSRICQERQNSGLMKRIAGFPRHIQGSLMSKSIWRLPLDIFLFGVRFLLAKIRPWFRREHTGA